jgi:hypothetical protein
MLFSSQMATDPMHRKIPLSDSGTIRTGDVIAFRRKSPVCYYHVGIARCNSAPNSSVNHVEIIAYITGEYVVAVQDFETAREDCEVFRYEWAPGVNVYSPEVIVERALSRLGEREYALFHNNCEHFAVWAATGVSFSEQAEEGNTVGTVTRSGMIGSGIAIGVFATIPPLLVIGGALTGAGVILSLIFGGNRRQNRSNRKRDEDRIRRIHMN